MVTRITSEDRRDSCLVDQHRRICDRQFRTSGVCGSHRALGATCTSAGPPGQLRRVGARRDDHAEAAQDPQQMVYSPT
jgi:hypothetical protein